MDEREGDNKETEKYELEVTIEYTQEACNFETVNGIRTFKCGLRFDC